MASKTETVSDKLQLESNQDLIDDFLGKEHWRMAPGNYWYSYHNDWNMLMPVVEKIEDVLLQVSIHTAYVNICGELNGVKYNQDTCFESQYDTKITVTYRAVLRAIQFINSQSPDTIKP